MRVRSFADVELMQPESLWPGFIPLSTPVLLAGTGGVGKGFLAADIIGRVTRADWPGNIPVMPDGTLSDVPSGNVVTILPEDDACTVVAWRLRAACADPSRVYDMTEGFTLPESLPALTRAVSDVGDVRLVVIDPLSAVSSVHLSSGAVRIRGALTNPLEAFAADTGVALLVVLHLTKDDKTVQGSKTITDAARVVLSASRSRQRDSIRQLSVLKGNNIRDDAVMSYTITGGPYGAHVEWLDTADAEGLPEDRTRERVLTALRESAGPLSPQQLATDTGASYGAVRVALHRLGKAGEAFPPSRGLWTVPRERAGLRSVREEVSQ